jgi:hypothetical protein
MYTEYIIYITHYVVDKIRVCNKHYIVYHNIIQSNL